MVKKYGKLFLLICFFVLNNSLKAQKEYSFIYEEHYKNKLEEYEKNVSALMKVDKSPGIAVAFVKGNFIWSKGFGKINIENEVDINSESLFNNKTLLRFAIASSILQLHKEGKIDLKKELQSYLNQTIIPQKSLSIKQILALLGPSIFTKFDQKNGFKSKENIDLHSTEIIYENLILLIEKIAEQKFKEYLKEKIWNPLLMFSTRLEDKKTVMKNRVSSYDMNRGKINNFIDVQNIGYKETLQIRMSVNDMIKFAYGFISNKLYKTIRYESLFLPLHDENNNSDINQEWAYQPVNGRFGIGFTNDKNDDNSILVVFPQDTFAIAIASNLKNADLFPYVKRLYHLVLDEPYNLKPYFKNLKHKRLFTTLDEIFNYGLSAYNMYGKKISDNNIDFELINEKLNIDEQHIINQNADNSEKNRLYYTKIGHLIAAKLSEYRGSKNLLKYHLKGCITYFNDYINLYKKYVDWPTQLKFNPSTEKIIINWERDWNTTLTNQIVQFYIDPGKNTLPNFEILKNLYKGKKIFPNLDQDFALAIEQFSKLNRMEDAHGLGAVGIEIFNKSPDIYHALGISFAWFKDADVTYDLFHKSQEFADPSFSMLNHFIAEAEDFKTWGKIKEAISMIDRATKLDKKQPKLYSYIGDLYLEINQKTKAKRFYKKSLKFDPEFEYAKMKIIELKDIQ